MSAPDKIPARLLSTETSPDFDDVGALVVAMRHMLTGGAPSGDGDARALYVLASMAETAWRRLDDAMTKAAS